MNDSDMNYVKGFDLFGVKARQIPCITGNGEPNNELALKIGLLYIDEDNGDMYKCIKVNGEEGLVWTLVNNKDTNTNSGQNVARMEPVDGDVPLVYFNGAKPEDKDNYVKAEMVYASKSKTIRAWVKIKYQGSSSMAYDKKNFTIKAYADQDCTVPMDLEFKDWGIKASKFVLKADFIDATHARNVCNARIWKDIVESRPDYDTLPEELKNAPGHGAIVGFPIVVYYNDEYQGLYNWNIGKDPWMWGMDEDNPNHAMMCAEINSLPTAPNTPCNFQGSLWSGIDGQGWSVEIGTNSDALKNCLNALIAFVANNDGENFINGIEQYLDLQSTMDYYAFAYANCGLDSLGKNMTIGTYDMDRWIFGAYDLDSTWLLWWSGTSFVPANYRCPEDYTEPNNLLFAKIVSNFTDRFKDNYFRLRSGPLSFANINGYFERYVSSIGAERYADDLVSYPGIPQAKENNILQLRNAIKDRLAYADFEIAAMGLTRHSVVNALTNVSNSNAAAEAIDGYAYTATLSPFAAATIQSVVVTMGGVDITADVYDNGVITIPSVAGDIVITAVADTSFSDEGLLYSLTDAVVFDGTNHVDTGIELGNNDWSIAVDFTYTEAANGSGLLIGHGEADTFQHNGITVGEFESTTNIRAYVYNDGSYMYGYGSGMLVGTNAKLVLTRNSATAITNCANSVDGTVKTPGSSTGAYADGKGNIYIGGAPDGDGTKFGFIGTVHACRIYNRILSDDEISAWLS